MADLHETFVSFNDNIKLSEKRKKELRTSRNAVREDIRKYFDENRDKHTVKFKGQGSFSMNTSILPERHSTTSHLAVLDYLSLELPQKIIN